MIAYTPNRFPTMGRPAPWARLPTRCLTPRSFFATLAVVQKKNSLCEPNFEDAQPYDLTGVQRKSAGKSEHQVAQADSGLTVQFSPPERHWRIMRRLAR
jgi:hypothetical protein